MPQRASDEERDGAIRCWACGAEFDAETWRSLALVQGVTPTEVQRVLLNWPSDRAVEVRSCRACGAKIARTVKGERLGILSARTPP